MRSERRPLEDRADRAVIPVRPPAARRANDPVAGGYRTGGFQIGRFGVLIPLLKLQEGKR
ncbi:hypothetical protein HMPREF0591_2873 [Mycobacterium parascrofulaceum ATCC BAA-614]|uniref:Uncharacterized protein n=1 Tax=Mycobacterium parascrofulaceum ATCC BAA-614 TaxID=525368 RepID=D5P9M9_9MYCO|nr:hypothetical protein HMPREF0591_2873 [Mycobacterium parascrofulaceum ATCC BAA-614]